MHAILGVEQVHVALPVDGLLEQAHAQARLQGRRILDRGRQLKGIAREDHALGRPDGNPHRGLQGLPRLVENGSTKPPSREHAVGGPDQRAADDLCRLQRPLGQEAFEAIRFLPQFPGLGEGLPAGGALVRPEGPELLFGFASGLLRLFAEGLDLFVVGVGRDEAVQRTVNDGQIDPHRMADADHIEPHGPEPLDEEVRRRIGRRRTQHLFPSTDKGLDELDQRGRLASPGRTVQGRDLRGAEGVGHGAVLGVVQVGMRERVGLDRLGPGVAEDDLPKRRKAAGLAIAARIEDVGQGPRHFLEAPFVEPGIEHPASVGGLFGEFLPIEHYLGFQSPRGADNASVRHGLALGIR